MRRKVLSFLVVAASLSFVSSPASAHHGVTNYDMKKTIVLTGTITAFDWGNPHCLAHVDVMEDNGNVRHWTLEMNSTFTLSHKGWDKDTLKRGDMVVVETHPARNGAPIGINSGPGFALKLVVNGKEIPSR
jgi:hypothetical protein